MGSRAHSGTDALPSLPSWWRHEPKTFRITAVNFTLHPLNHLCVWRHHSPGFLFPRKPLKMIRSVRWIWGFCVVRGEFSAQTATKMSVLCSGAAVCLGELGHEIIDRIISGLKTHILLWYRFWKCSCWVAAAVLASWNSSERLKLHLKHTRVSEGAVHGPSAAAGGALSSCRAADLRTVTSWPHGRERGGQEVIIDYV